MTWLIGALVIVGLCVAFVGFAYAAAWASEVLGRRLHRMRVRAAMRKLGLSPGQVRRSPEHAPRDNADP